MGCTMRTLNSAFLAANPTGDEKAIFTMSAKVPDKVNVPVNPDGTRPRITITATGNTYLEVLGALTTLHEDPEPVLEGLMACLMTEDELDAFATLEAAAPLIKERFAEVTVPFTTHTLGFEVSDGSDIELAITAPSATVGTQALHFLTKPHVLMQMAIGFCPETDDDEDDYSDNEVLVIR